LGTRRDFLRTATVAAGGMALAGAVTPLLGQGQRKLKVGMCDWNLGATADLAAVARAAEIGLDGVEVSLGDPGNFPLRDPKVRAAYLEAGKERGVVFPSMAMGCLNGTPLKSEPVTGLWVADCITAAHDLGAKVILLAFFGNGTLDLQDKEGVRRVIEVLKELAPRAQDAGATLGLENTLSADDNLQIIQRVNHEAVRVYYDIKNSADAGRDTAAEIRQLGKLICQVHLKNGNSFLEQVENVDFAQSAQALRDIDYDGWYVLETSSPNGLVPDTRRNMQYVRKTF